jgi:hypothetical protein
MPRYLLCGSRTWRWPEPVEELIETFPDDAVIIHGAARGLDAMAGEFGFKQGLDVEAYLADWTQHGKSAGPIRNAKMLATGIDTVYAFLDSDETSPGTHNMISQAHVKGIPVVEYHSGKGWMP